MAAYGLVRDSVLWYDTACKRTQSAILQIPFLYKFGSHASLLLISDSINTTVDHVFLSHGLFNVRLCSVVTRIPSVWLWQNLRGMDQNKRRSLWLVLSKRELLAVFVSVETDRLVNWGQLCLRRWARWECNHLDGVEGWPSSTLWVRLLAFAAEGKSKQSGDVKWDGCLLYVELTVDMTALLVVALCGYVEILVKMWITSTDKYLDVSEFIILWVDINLHSNPFVVFALVRVLWLDGFTGFVLWYSRYPAIPHTEREHWLEIFAETDLCLALLLFPMAISRISCICMS